MIIQLGVLFKWLNSATGNDYFRGFTNSIQNVDNLDTTLHPILTLWWNDFLIEYTKCSHTSSSFSSNILSRLSGMSSFRPFRKLSICSLTAVANRYWARESRYWSLFSLVTGILEPFGIKSITWKDKRLQGHEKWYFAVSRSWN